MPTVSEIEPTELHALLANDDLFLLDVREPEEHALGVIQGAELVPMMELQSRFEELRQLAEAASLTVVYCRIGGRSAKVIEWLQGMGVGNLKNLRGGINAYSEEVECSLNAY